MIDLAGDDLISYVLSIPAEDRRTEFKRLGDQFDVKKIMESIIALTNTDGGYIVFGVDDPEKTRRKGMDRVLLNSKKNGEWDKVSDYLSNKEKYINNEKVREITGNPDSSKVSRLLKKWVDQGVLVKIETRSKRSVKYRLPVDKDEGYLFARGGCK